MTPCGFKMRLTVSQFRRSNNNPGNLSQMIFRIARDGTARIAPGTPHIQNQNTSDKMTSTGLSVKRRASSKGRAKNGLHY
jgi:hypothetical protein